MTEGADGYLIFVDESGDHGLETVDPAYPVFVLAFCIVAKSEYARHVLPAVTEFKFRHFGHDQVILHERDIRKDLGEFSNLKDPQRKTAFLDELTGIVGATELTIIASVIHKTRLIGQYRHPENPYEIALGFGLERAYRWLGRHGATGTTTPVIIECRGKREDADLELEFRRVCAGQNYMGATLNMEPRFVPKSANVAGLQLADLVARPIGRHVLAPEQPNRAFDVIRPKLDKNRGGEIRGWGLKVFP